MRKNKPNWNEAENNDINTQPLVNLDNLSHISHQEASTGGHNDSNHEYEGNQFKDKRDSTGLLGVMMASQLNKKKPRTLKKRINEKDKINESRESVGSFSELVLEQYDKMKLDPKLGYKDTESDAGQPEEAFQEYKPRSPRSNSPRKG